MNVNKWLKLNTEILAGKTVAVTGTTGGLGREICLHLASLGASIILMDRNAQRSEKFRLELESRFAGATFRCINVDMTDIDSVKNALAVLENNCPDIMIHNAGAYSIPRCTCKTGYDNVFQINFLAPYYIARHLFPSVSERGGRIILVSSIAHNYSESDESDVDFSTQTKPSLVYGNAKRRLTYSLTDLYGKTGAISITHPGITFTNITAHYPKLIFAIIKYPMKVIFMSPRRAALSILSGIFTPTDRCEWIGPRLFCVWGLPKKKRLTTAREDEIKRICESAEEIFGKISNL